MDSENHKYLSTLSVWLQKGYEYNRQSHHLYYRHSTSLCPRRVSSWCVSSYRFCLIKMHQLNIPPRLTPFIGHLLSGRTISDKHQLRGVPPKLVWKLLPQGSVLSPLLHNIYTLSVNNFCNTIQYTDNIVLHSSSKSVEDINFRINTALHYLG